ncbi:MAG TPA: hypothetical protein VNH83_08370 [Bryobacteraceae bacterium]|nr:hypothetical protein [Bryobacteraceae bacterium]
MECLHCGKKLGVVRKLQKDEFCSAAHRKAYAKKQNDDALDFLMKSKPVLRRPVQPIVERSAPPPVEPRPLLVPAQFVAEQVAPGHASTVSMRDAQPLEPARAAILPACAHPAGPRLLHSPHVSAASLAHAAPARGRKPAPKVAQPFEAVRPHMRVTVAHPIWIGADRPVEPKQRRAGFVATQPTWTDLTSHPLRTRAITKFTVSPAIRLADPAPRGPSFRLAPAQRTCPEAATSPRHTVERNGSARQLYTPDVHMQTAATSVRASGPRLCGRMPVASPAVSLAPERAAAIASGPVVIDGHLLLRGLHVVPRSLSLSPASRAQLQLPHPAAPPIGTIMGARATLCFKSAIRLGPFTRVGPVRPSFDTARPAMPIRGFAPETRRWDGRRLAGFWCSAPQWSRRLAVGVPVIAALVFSAGRMKTSVSVRNAQAAMIARIRQRATIEVQDDFRSGLSRWSGAPNWAGSWTYDPTGFARPGRLALLSGSQPMSDYRLEFLAQIEKKAMGWVFRAADTRNYYAMKLVVSKHGTAAGYSIVHYAVIDGHQKLKIELPLPITATSKTMLRVRQEIREDQFTTYLDGRLVDTWSDATLIRGGIGFFSDPGESAYIRWVDVIYNDDALGRFCSYLAPRHAD